ncbi:MAG TPA: NAD(P)H-dependent oxidoreductase [Candidatus Polarisedimenticolia bacterium]|nr:NAD(P)H-dependent oxidoreductase [Candidatus Polarisedimenticolia bacterium]
MSESPLNVLAVAGSLHRKSVTRIVIHHVAEKMRADGNAVDLLDLQNEPLPLYNPDTSYNTPEFQALQKRVDKADVLVLGTPDYHGSISSTLKNFLDHFWHEFAGKLFVTVVASHEKGLTATDQLRTVARQCYAWTLPYGISFAENTDMKDGQVVTNGPFEKRLEMMIRDARVYGHLLTQQRAADLKAQDHCFMARHRK